MFLFSGGSTKSVTDHPFSTTEGEYRVGFAALPALALLPFLAKGLVLAFGAHGYVLQSLYKVFQLIAPCLWRYRWRQARGLRIFWPTDEPMPSVATWLLAVGQAIALSGFAVVAALWLLPYMQIEPRQIRTGLDARFQVSSVGALLVVAFLSLVNSGLEELHFRAWLDRELSDRFGSPTGVLLSAAAFGGMHVLIFLGMPGIPAIGVVLVPSALAIASVTWSVLMRRQGGIHAAWLSHGLTDALLMSWGLHWLGYL